MLQPVPKIILIAALGVLTSQRALAGDAIVEKKLVQAASFEVSESFKDLVVVTDFNNIISISRSPDRLSDYTPLMSFKGFWKAITLLPTLFGKFDEIKKMGMQIAQNIHGNGNIVHELAWQLKTKGYGDITGLQDDIIKLTVLDEPIVDNIEIFKKLKVLGMKLIAATDQDALHHTFYKQRMIRKGIDLDQLFDLVITYKSFRDIEQSERYTIINIDKNERNYLNVIHNILQSKFYWSDKKIVYVDNGSLKSGKTLKSFEIIEFEDMQGFVNQISGYADQVFSIDEVLKKPEESKKRGRFRKSIF